MVNDCHVDENREETGEGIKNCYPNEKRKPVLTRDRGPDLDVSVLTGPESKLENEANKLNCQHGNEGC